MSGRSQSLAMASFTGVRIAGKNGVAGPEGCTVRFTPAHFDPTGKPVSSKAEFSVYRNTVGDSGRNDPFRMTAWNDLAETCCKSLPPGKAIDVFCEPQSYLGKVYDENRNPRLGADGQPILVRKVGFTIIRIAFGEDADKRIIYETSYPDVNNPGNPRVIWEWRPMNWDKPGHPDVGVWQAIRAERNKATWDGKSDVFGYARVIIPAGRLDWTKINKGTTQHLAGVQPQGAAHVPAAPAAPTAPQAQVPAAIAHIMGAAGGGAPQAPVAGGDY